ncbi:M35 family metallo-endopeptidase [Paraburkholderia youngii]|uniref:M35 family metallo-endopeptidase n=1 Tax=Paraburkholderia youngii TaxID=2782701 RepID=UPI0020CD91E5|nr:M35 family metallo-endopeptidase [Paraburkholderia youngii]
MRRSAHNADEQGRQIEIRPRFGGGFNFGASAQQIVRGWHDCQVLTLIHECTHFTDVFNSTDDMYGVTIGLSFWAQDNPAKAIRNADSLACYVGFND